MLNLRQIRASDPQLQKLQNYLVDKFTAAVNSRQNQIQGTYRRWIDNYAGKPLQAIRTTPYYKASNFVPQLIRMHTDIMSARIIGLIFGTRPMWRVKSFLGAEMLSNDTMLAVGEWMDKLCEVGINFYEPIDLTMFLTAKCGTQVIKGNWIDEKRIIAAGDGELKAIGNPKLEFDVIPFDDFFPYPVTARNLSQTIVRFQRLRMAKEEVEFREHIGAWDKAAIALLLAGNATAPPNTPRESEANQTGIALTPDVTRPYDAVEAHLDYELEPGKKSALIATFNPRTRDKRGILRAVYDYNPVGAYTDFRIMPREDLFWGYSIPEILEQSQEEQAQIHNARRDGNTIALVPGWKKKRLSDVGNPNVEWYPGKVFEVDAMDDLEPLAFGVNYNSLVEEEQALMALAERYTGISPAMQGFGSGPMGKKGIYASQATLALLSEGNKRLDILLKRMRRPYHQIGTQIFSSYKDFADPSEWSQYGSNGELLKRAFDIQHPVGYNGMFFGLSASDASANKEVDRSNLLLMANTMAAYYNQILTLVPNVVSAPEGSTFRELGLQVLDGARDLANRILFSFDVFDRKTLIPDIRKLLGGGEPGNETRTLDQAGVPPAEDAVSNADLSELSSTVAKIAGSAGMANAQRPNA